MIERSTVGSLLRCTQAFSQQICDKETLQYGIAFSSSRFPQLPDANQFREVTVGNREQTIAAVEEGLAWFTGRNLSCHVVAPAIGQSTADFELALAPHGFALRRFAALRLTRWADLPSPADIRVLPARAMRSAVRDSFLADPGIPAPARESAAEAFAERLDDSALDTFVALVNGKTAGRCALYQVGDLARVMDLVVLPPYRAAAVDSALLHQTLGLARRLAIKHVLAQVNAAFEARLAWLLQSGFEHDGEIVEFHASAAPLSGDVR